MNGQKYQYLNINPIIEKHEEENEDDYLIIQEEYKSSPRFGIKSEIVKNSIENVLFSPLEISTNPYFKYCVTQIKEEPNNDISQTETTNTKNEKIKPIENTKVRKSIHKAKTKLIKEYEDNGEDNDSDDTHSHYIQLIEKEESNMTIKMVFTEEKSNKNKNKKNKLKICKTINPNNVKDRRGSISTNNVRKKKNYMKQISQKSIYKILNNIVAKDTPIKLKPNLQLENGDSTFHSKSTFNIHSYGPNKDKLRKNTPNNSYKEKKENSRVIPYLTTNNIKHIKKSKKTLEQELKEKARKQKSFTKSDTKQKEVIINRKRLSCMPNFLNRKGGKGIFNMTFNNNDLKENKMKNFIRARTKHLKLKSLDSEFDKTKLSNKKQDGSCTPRKKINYFNNFRIEDDNHNKNEIARSYKGRKKYSIFETNSDKRRKKLVTEEKKNIILNKKKSYFFSIKERNLFKVKKKNTKEKNKKTKKTKKQDDKKQKKDKDNQSIKKVIRKDKSFTMISKTNRNLINEVNKSSSNENENYQMPSFKDIVVIESKKDNSIKIAPKNLNDGMETKRTDKRRNSSKGICRDNHRQEKITAYTNKQTIDNINEYTLQCLEIIPDLYELGSKMPRCKTRINPNFSVKKKIALFDLDETLVHCIGEINMNNVESFSRQSDAKIKVQLPGGGRLVTIGINIRPYWKEALNKIMDKYHIIAFTASHESYADSVLNYIDPDKKYFEYRLYRSHCVLCVVNEMKFYVKDLKILEDTYDLKDVVLIDNSVLSFAYHLDNGIPISPFYDSKNDTELLDIADFLTYIADENDIRDKLKEVYKLNQYLKMLELYNSEENEESSDTEGKNGDMTYKKFRKIQSKFKDKQNENNDKTHKKELKFVSNQSQINLKEVRSIFNERNEEEENTHKSRTPNFNSYAFMKSFSKSIPKGDLTHKYRRKDKRIATKLDINFKKEWDKKQKKLKH